MKAAVFKEVGKPLQVETVEDPTPASTELVVKVGLLWCLWHRPARHPGRPDNGLL